MNDISLFDSFNISAWWSNEGSHADKEEFGSQPGLSYDLERLFEGIPQLIYP